MDAVGHVSDRDVALGRCGPDVLPHAARDFAVQAADAVGEPAAAQGEDGHRERFVLVGDVLAPQGHETLHVEAELLVVSREVVLHQLDVKVVDAGGNGRVGGEQMARGHSFASLIEAQARSVAQLPDALQSKERGVPLVHVEDRRRFVDGVQGANAADPQDDLLLDAAVLVAEVEVRGDLAILGRVFGEVGVQEKEPHLADVGAPDGAAHFASWHLHAYGDLAPALEVHDALHGLAHWVERRVELLLKSGPVELLMEVPVPVQKPDSNQGQAELRRRFEVVAGEEAKAAGIDLEALGDAELGAEIRGLEGSGVGREGSGVAGEPTGIPHLLAKFLGGLGDPCGKLRVRGGLGELFGRDERQQLDRVVARRFPKALVEALEELYGARAERPEEVVRNVQQRPEFLGEGRRDASEGGCGRRFGHVFVLSDVEVCLAAECTNGDSTASDAGGDRPIRNRAGVSEPCLYLPCVSRARGSAEV